VLPFYTFAAYHQGPWSIHTIHVCSLALLIAWVALSSHRAPGSKLHLHMLLVKYTQVCKGNSMFTNNVTHVCLHENMILLIHTSLAYDICSGLDELVNGTSIGLFKLSMVLRLKRPSLIKFRHV
jgi:hypothetical protein